MWLEKGGVFMNKTEFGSFIRESRIKKNYTQKELADLLFIDVSAVSKWERGYLVRSPRQDTVSIA